jgi:pantetheine-phosphate adenylyltransferase
LEERVDLLAASTAHLTNVEAIAHSGLLVELAGTLGVDALLRSAGKERTNEFEMAYANTCLAGIATVLVPSQADSWWISSRIVRERFDRGDLDAVAEMVPLPVASALGIAGVGKPRP